MKKKPSQIEEDLIFPLPIWFVAVTIARYVFFQIFFNFKLSSIKNATHPNSSLNTPKLRTRPLNIGHRGCRGNLPENSMESFAYALEFADGFELDTQLSQDLVPIVLHDSTLDRTTNSKGYASTIKSHELTSILLSNGEPLPRLESVLERFGNKTIINVEIKKELTLKSTIQSVRSIGNAILKTRFNREKMIVSSFSPLTLYYCQKFFPRIQRAQLIADPKTSGIKGFRGWLLGTRIFAIAWNATGVVWEKTILLSNSDHGQNLVKKAHKCNQSVWVYTSNEPKEWKFLSEIGVDGIITDRPKEFQEEFNSL
jgi:glycerophosphoryl diester phosphodiesterase